MGTLGGARSNASGVDGKVIAGWAWDSSEAWQPVVWEPDSAPGAWVMRELDTLGDGGGCFDVAAADTCGCVVDGSGGPFKPAMWSAGSLEALAPLDGSDQGVLYSMNGQGAAVGWSWTGPAPFSNPSAQAMILRGGELVSLNELTRPSVPGLTLREAWFINDAGEIAGLGAIDGEVRAFVLRPCVGDCNADFTLDFFVFLCFQNRFAAGDTVVDCDRSGDLDFFDFLCFQNAFAAGCP